MIRVLLLNLIFFFTPLTSETLPITLEHAATPVELARGLMERASLDGDSGMTFNYGSPRFIKIWMLNCLIDLSVAFLDENKVIQELHELKAYPGIHDTGFFDMHSVTTSFQASYALEMNKGWFAKNGVHVGDKAEWDIHSPNGKIITNR